MKSFKRNIACAKQEEFFYFMRKIFTVFVSTLAIFMLLTACKVESSTILNAGSKIFYGGSQIETTVHELKVDGGTTSARVRFLNLGTEDLTSIEAQVEFIDGNGKVISTVIISDTFTTPVAVGDSFSETAQCDSDSRIKGVFVSEYVPEG